VGPNLPDLTTQQDFVTLGGLFSSGERCHPLTDSTKNTSTTWGYASIEDTSEE
jgi:hypothetical protein